MTLPAAKDWSAFSRDRFMKGQLLVTQRGDGLLAAAQRLLDGARRADVHGGPGAAHRLRQRREPADRARLHAAERDCRPPLARRVARSAGDAAARREPGAVVRRRRRRPRSRLRADARPAGADSVGWAAAPDPARAGPAHPRLYTGADLPDRHRLRSASGAAREPARSVDDVEGHRWGRLPAPAGRSFCARGS